MNPKHVDKFNLLIQIIVNEYAPMKIILFGSQARGDWNDDSDFDIFILDPKRSPIGLYPKTFGLNLGFSFDYFVYSSDNFYSKDNKQVQNVIQDLKVVYEQSSHS